MANLKDKLGKPPTDGDMLANMFTKQWALEQVYRPMEAAKGHFPQIADANHFPVDLNNEHAQIFVKDAMERLIEELMEAANVLKNKPWKNTHVDTDVPHFIEELMDAWHFMLRLSLIVLGPDADKLVYQYYFDKAAVNDFRQRTNY